MGRQGKWDCLEWVRSAELEDLAFGCKASAPVMLDLSLLAESAGKVSPAVDFVSDGC